MKETLEKNSGRGDEAGTLRRSVNSGNFGEKSVRSSYGHSDHLTSEIERMMEGDEEDNTNAKGQAYDSADGEGSCLRSPPTRQEKLQKGRSRRRRGTKPSKKMMDKNFLVEPVPRRNRRTKARLVKYVSEVGAWLKSDEANSIEWEDEILLKVGGVCASLSSCFSVLPSNDGGVDDNYVRAATALYQKIWKRKHGDHSLRYMLDPTFGIRLGQAIASSIGWDDCIRLAESYAELFSGYPVVRFLVVFVPVREGSHWWCAAHSVNTDEVWLIDPVADNPCEAHDSKRDELGYGCFF